MTYFLAIIMWLNVFAPVPLTHHRQQRGWSSPSVQCRPIHMHSAE